MTKTAKEWIYDYSKALGVAAPSDEEFDQILALAAEAAHLSERTAAPVACWIAAREGLDAARATAVAEGLAEGSAD